MLYGCSGGLSSVLKVLRLFEMEDTVNMINGHQDSVGTVSYAKKFTVNRAKSNSHNHVIFQACSVFFLVLH